VDDDVVDSVVVVDAVSLVVLPLGDAALAVEELVDCVKSELEVVVSLDVLDSDIVVLVDWIVDSADDSLVDSVEVLGDVVAEKGSLVDAADVKVVEEAPLIEDLLALVEITVDGTVLNGDSDVALVVETDVEVVAGAPRIKSPE